MLAFYINDRTQEIMLHFIQRGKRNDDNDDDCDDAPPSRETAANDFYTLRALRVVLPGKAPRPPTPHNSLVVAKRVAEARLW